MTRGGVRNESRRKMTNESWGGEEGGANTQLSIIYNLYVDWPGAVYIGGEKGRCILSNNTCSYSELSY